MSALRSFDAWLIAYEIVRDAPDAVKAEREAAGLNVPAAAAQMIAVSPYMLRKFEQGLDVPTSALTSILLWLAGARRPEPQTRPEEAP